VSSTQQGGRLSRSAQSTSCLPSATTATPHAALAIGLKINSRPIAADRRSLARPAPDVPGRAVLTGAPLARPRLSFPAALVGWSFVQSVLFPDCGGGGGAAGAGREPVASEQPEATAGHRIGEMQSILRPVGIHADDPHGSVLARKKCRG